MRLRGERARQARLSGSYIGSGVAIGVQSKEATTDQTVRTAT